MHCPTRHNIWSPHWSCLFQCLEYGSGDKLRWLPKLKCTELLADWPRLLLIEFVYMHLLPRRWDRISILVQQDTNYILEKYCNRTKSHHDSSWLDRLWKDKKLILYKNDERNITYKDRRGTLGKLFEARDDQSQTSKEKKEKKTKIALELSFNVLVTITVSTNRPCHSFLNFRHVTNYEKSVDSSEMSTFKLIQFPNLNVTCWKLTKI